MNRGFTLIEILVSVALFSVVMVVALGTLLSLSTAARRAETLNSAMNNLGSAVDSMTRTIRTGTSYYCGYVTTAAVQDCASGPSVTVLAADTKTVTGYCLYDTTSGSVGCTSGLSCPANHACIVMRQACTSSSTCVTQPLTGKEVNINYLSFSVRGSANSVSGNTVQPIVNMVMSGTINVKGALNSQFNLQTSVTQRIYDQ